MEIVKGIATTLRFPEVDADPVSLSGPTVTVVRDSDGKTIVDKGATEKHEEGAYFTHDLKGIEIPEVDLLTITWADANSSIEQKVEVVGGYACSLEAVKKKLAEDAEDIASNYPDALIRQERERATRDIEAACWDGFRHRYAKETISGDNGSVLILNKRHVVKILSLETNEVVLTEKDIAEFSITDIGIERKHVAWPYGRHERWASDWSEGTNNIVIAYVYGHDNFPSAANPVRDLTADYLVQHPTDWEERATSYTDTDGNNYRMVTAGEKGKRFNLPSVNAFVADAGTVRLL